MVTLIRRSSILLLISAFTLIRPSLGETLQGRVVGITDGDTITLLDASNMQWKIRLLGIDAPESKQEFGRKSKEALSSVVFNRQVSVEYNKKDRYGRTVGKIIVDGIDANLEQVKFGMAWHFKKYQKEQSLEDRAIYTQAESQARKDKRGLWQNADPMPPWIWRKNH